MLSVALVFVPLIIIKSADTDIYRNSFTMLMQWGIAPAYLYFLIKERRKILDFNSFKKDYRFKAFIYSLLLMLIGFLYGSLIRGPDLRVPAHYHAVIGSVTLAFMIIAYEILASNNKDNKWIIRCIHVFTYGQVLFSTALFVAGVYGFERKTYASENIVNTWAHHIVFFLMPVGGLMAFVGGAFFAISIYKKLRTHCWDS
ncbi:MAG: hypothetical protein MK008_13960 [Bdellovibrionales bacterium]|nr:hypothetical protein [Bdellovibrionales bacterium]